MIFRAIFEITHDDGSKLPSNTREFNAESWHEVLEQISAMISNPPYEVQYHMDLINLSMVDRRDY